jgi:hypothetical protein
MDLVIWFYDTTCFINFRKNEPLLRGARKTLLVLSTAIQSGRYLGEQSWSSLKPGMVCFAHGFSVEVVRLEYVLYALIDDQGRVIVGTSTLFLKQHTGMCGK